MKTTCTTCGCEFEITAETMSKKVCPICGADILKELENITPEKENVVSKELMRIQCMGATAFNMDRVLILWNDHIALVKNNGEILFDETYDNVSCLKGGTFLAPTFLKLVLEDGTEKQIKLNGNDFSMLKVAKTLPNFVADLIKEYQKK